MAHLKCDAPVFEKRDGPCKLKRTLPHLAVVLGAAACLGCTGPRGVAFVLVGHEYLLAGTVVDAQTRRPLGNAALTLKVRTLDRDALRAPLRRGAPIVGSRRTPTTSQAADDGTFEIRHTVKRCEQRRYLFGIRLDRGRRQPAVAFLLTAACPGYRPATREILPPQARSDDGRYEMIGLRIDLMPEGPPSPH